MEVSKASVKRFVLLTILFLAIILVGKAVFFSSSYLPEEFVDARINGSSIAEEIVAQSNFSAELLKTISKLDREKKYGVALEVVSQEMIKNQDANKKAIKLSTQLEQMARLVEGIRPYQARQLATEALSSEVALVTRLINYNNYLGLLFSVLQKKFQSGNYSTNGEAQQLVNSINEEIRMINELNKRFNDSLKKFDEVF